MPVKIPFWLKYSRTERLHKGVWAKIQFLKNLGRLLNSGTSLSVALDSLYFSCPGNSFKNVISGIRSQVLEGHFFSEACREYPHVFDDMMCGVIQGGEQSGVLGDSLIWVAENQRRYLELRRQTVLTLLYPGIVLLMSVFVGIFYVFFILPKFESLFHDMLIEDHLPLFSEMVFDYASSVVVALPLVFSLFIALFVLIRRRSRKHTYKMEGFLFRLPLVGKLKWYSLMGRFFSMYGLLGRSGFSSLNAMRQTCNVMARGFMESVFRDLEDQMQHGIYLSQALDDAFLLGETDLQMIVDGEKRGQVFESCMELSDTFFRREEDVLARIAKLTEPVLVVLLSFYIGMLVLALILPLSQLLQQMV
jgi:type IV pilus assembly protein PilC